MSWVITHIPSGKFFETWSKNNVKKAQSHDDYKVTPIVEHLNSINRRIKINQPV